MPDATRLVVDTEFRNWSEMILRILWVQDAYTCACSYHYFSVEQCTLTEDKISLFGFLGGVLVVLILVGKSSFRHKE